MVVGGPSPRSPLQVPDLQVAGLGAVVVPYGFTGSAVVPLLFVGNCQGPGGILEDGRVVAVPENNLE